MHKPQYATAQQLADYFAWMVETGKGHLPVLLDRRGLTDLCEQARIGFAIPPNGETSSNAAVFLRAVA